MQAITGGPRAALTEDEVISALALNHSPRVRWRMEVSVDGGLTYDDSPLDIRTGGEVKWSYRVPLDAISAPTEVSSVRRTASFTVVGDIGAFDITNARWRPRLDISSPAGHWVPFYCGVFVSTLPPMSYDGILTERELDLADKTHIYAQQELTEPYVVPYLRNGMLEVREDLEARFGETEFAFPVAPEVVQDDLFFEPGTPLLHVYNAVLEACGYEPLFVDEEGRPSSRRADALIAAAPEWTYESGTTMTAPGQIQPMLPVIPNRLIVASSRGPSLAEEGNGIRTVENLTYGPASFAERGYWVPHRIEVEAQDQDDLDAMAIEMAMRYFAGGGLTYTGQVGLNPLHGDRDVVMLRKPSMGLGVDGDENWVVTGWTLPVTDVEDEGSVLMDLEMERLVVPSYTV